MPPKPNPKSMRTEIYALPEVKDAMERNRCFRKFFSMSAYVTHLVSEDSKLIEAILIEWRNGDNEKRKKETEEWKLRNAQG